MDFHYVSPVLGTVKTQTKFPKYEKSNSDTKWQSRMTKQEKEERGNNAMQLLKM